MWNVNIKNLPWKIKAWMLLKIYMKIVVLMPLNVYTQQQNDDMSYELY